MISLYINRYPFGDPDRTSSKKAPPSAAAPIPFVMELPNYRMPSLKNVLPPFVGEGKRFFWNARLPLFL